MKKLVFFKKSKPPVNKEKKDDKLEYFKKLILDHLDSIEDGAVMEKGAKLPIGTIRDWKGKKYIKGPDGKWKPKYDGHTRGAKMAVAAIRRKVAAAKDAQEMMQIILANRDRFSDKDGHPLPFVQELSKYVSEKGDAIDTANNKKAAKKQKAKEKPQEIKEKPSDTEGTQQERVEKIKDDYAAGKSDFYTTVKEYMAICPKVSKKDAEETVAYVFKQPKKKGTWENPIEKFSDIPPVIIANTVAKIYKNRDEDNPERKANRRRILKDYNLSDEAIEVFEKYIAGMTAADARKADKYVEENKDDPKAKEYQEEHRKQSDEKERKKRESLTSKQYKDKRGTIEFKKIDNVYYGMWSTQPNGEKKQISEYMTFDDILIWANRSAQREGKKFEYEGWDGDKIRDSSNIGDDGTVFPSWYTEESKAEWYERAGIDPSTGEAIEEENETDKNQEEQKNLVIERLMEEGFDTLEKYVNKEISRYEFRQYLKEHRYTVEQINDIENFAATLKPTNKQEKKDKSDILNDNGQLKPGTRMTGAEWKELGYTGYITNGTRKHKMLDDAYYTADNFGDIFEKYEDQQNREKQQKDEKELTEEEKHRNRSEAMKGNKNAYKGGPKEQPESERIAEQEETAKAREKAEMPPVEKRDRVSAMKDTTWNPKSKDYRYKDTGYIAGSRKELAHSYIKKMAKTGERVTNETIDWTGIEENDVAAADIITKQNLMGKLDYEALQSEGLKGGAGYLINELLKTINSRPEKATADNRFNFSRGLDAIRSRLETCKTLDDVIDAIGEIQGEMTGHYISAKKAPEYLATAEKKVKLEKKIDAHEMKLRDEIYKDGDPYAEADAYIKNHMGIYSGVEGLLNPKSGAWGGSVYIGKGRDKLYELLEKGRAEYNRRQEEIEKRIGITLSEMCEGRKKIIEELRKISDEKSAEKHTGNDMAKAWATFGKSFTAAINTVVDSTGMNYDRYELQIKNKIPKYVDSPTFANHIGIALGTTDDDFTWAEKKKTGGGNTGPRKTQFELQVADKIVRKGGREVKAETTEALKTMYNLRDVQLGNWVANDVKSAKFHVDNVAMGLADLADITGIPDNLVSLNGRLALALGARGVSKFLAHYEPVERVINITKMKGGGSLGHEWWHAFDNLIADAMTGGRYNMFLSETGQFDDLKPMQKHILDNLLYYKRMKEKYPSYQSDYERLKEKAEKAGIKVDKIESGDEHIILVKQAFSNLVNAMMSGAAEKTKTISYTKDDIEKAKALFEKGYNSGVELAKKQNKPIDEVLKGLEFTTYYSYSGKRRAIKGDELKRLAVAYLDSNPDGGSYDVKTEETTSHYFENSKKLDNNPEKPYWSNIKELGARAFTAYLGDRMKERGWENNYLAHAMDNTYYHGGTKPYPEGEEREAINKAFDELFMVINESGAIRKAIDIENAWRSVFGREAAIDEAINGALRFFNRVRHGTAKFEKRKVFLNKSGAEAYRWVGEEIKTPTKAKKTIAVDFDGVINSYTSGWQGPTETDEPVVGAAQAIRELYERGHKIIVFSTRANTPEGEDAIRKYIMGMTETPEVYQAIEVTSEKPIADIYIDDHAMTFTGDWETTLENIETFKPWNKSLTFSGFPLQGRTKVQGMDISIENKKGSLRSGTDKDGHEWQTMMHFDYGYIRGTVGVDKDHLDAYVGPNPESEIVYIVNQNDPVTGKFDEQKVMLGFNSEAAAKEAYLKQYDRPGFFGDIVKMDIDTFKEEAFNPENKGKPLKKNSSDIKAGKGRLITHDDLKKAMETREEAYGVDLDYVLDFDDWLKENNLEATEATAIQWINEWGAEIEHPDDLVNAIMAYSKERDEETEEFLEKALKNLAKLQKKEIINKRGKKQTVWVKTGMETKNMNSKETRIKEIEQTLNAKVEKEIAKTDQGYVARNKQGDIYYTDDRDKAIPLSNHIRKRLPQNAKIEKKEFPADIHPWDKEKLEKELSALKAGYGSAKERDEAYYKSKKSDFENSILKDIIGDDFYYELSGEFTVNIKKLTKAIADEAIKQGAELYHTSKDKGEITSFYLKKDGKKVRVSNHELPQIMNRADPEYQENWHKNLTLGNNRFIMNIVRLTTREEFSTFVKNLFGETE
ncbi:MAG: hypothetical protein LBQ89_08170 [Treponema sp.]|jgi:hypothetical protein|nr:hypothetical protein [Treponema sp.]